MGDPAWVAGDWQREAFPREATWGTQILLVAKSTVSQV
jgi:hypothetical protein